MPGRGRQTRGGSKCCFETHVSVPRFLWPITQVTAEPGQWNMLGGKVWLDSWEWPRRAADRAARVLATACKRVVSTLDPEMSFPRFKVC